MGVPVVLQGSKGNPQRWPPAARVVRRHQYSVSVPPGRLAVRCQLPSRSPVVAAVAVVEEAVMACSRPQVPVARAAPRAVVVVVPVTPMTLRLREMVDQERPGDS